MILYICVMIANRILRLAIASVLTTAGILSFCGCTQSDGMDEQKALSTLRDAEESRASHTAYGDTAALKTAISHFRSTEDNAHEIQALYYAGLASFHAGEAEEAVRLALAAIDRCDSYEDELYKARAHELLADAYRSVFNLKVARIHRKNAVESYEKAGYRKNAFYASMDLASEYSHELNDSARILMKEAVRLADSNDPGETSHYNFVFADICRVRGEYSDALASFRAIGTETRKDILTSSDSVYIGEIYYHNEMYDSAYVYFNTPAAEENIEYWACMADRHEREGNYLLALEDNKHIRNLEYDQTGASLSNSLEFTERSFYERKAQEAGEKHRRLIITLAVCGAILLLGSLTVLLLRYYRKSKSLKAENEIKDVALIVSAQEAKPQDDHTPHREDRNDPEDNCDSGKENDDKDKWVNVILDFYMQRLNQISREYFKVNDEESLRTIEAEFNRELRSLRNGDIFDEIERRLNERNDGIATKIRRQFPKFNEQYVRLMLCSLAGLSSQSTCLLLSIGKGNYYMMWTRVRARIRASDVPDKPIFESLFLKRT